MKLHNIALLTAAATIALAPVVNAAPVGITPNLMKLEFKHNGKKLHIQRNQDNKNKIAPFFASTSRKCPPFCVQPQVLMPGVETIAELEVIKYIHKMTDGDKSILVLDSRTPNFMQKTGTIPGAINVPWTNINQKKGATAESIIKTLKLFGAKLKKGHDEIAVSEAVAAGKAGGSFDFSNAKTLVVFCNGMWCGQSPSNIKDLVNKYNYPKSKIKWYRGGMQDWSVLGFNVHKF